jgi:hypothetical protein
MRECSLLLSFTLTAEQRGDDSWYNRHGVLFIYLGTCCERLKVLQYQVAIPMKGITGSECYNTGRNNLSKDTTLPAKWY